MSARKEDISHIVSAINNSAYYFTTSSCSGRILLIDGHSLAINSGFRNSGLTVDKKGKIITAVRSTHGLVVPLSHKGQVLVKEDYIYFLVEVANQKMEENVKQIERFYEWLQSALQPAELQSPSRQETEEKSVYKQRRKRGQTNV
ncbi:tRNA wybutosine-synthesizing protein 3 homolog [Oncorhynchus masou masou]|uniref:tRNA wybutosine-synthesizing protein 3 homolog n=1 Tax=Oncorhynchus masou masou TaxID=90313 RepID=UPI003182FCE4